MPLVCYHFLSPTPATTLNSVHMPHRQNQPTASANVYVASLPAGFTDQQLLELLVPYGSITSARVMCDPKTGQCKGYGFVLFESEKSAAAAIQGLSGYAIDGHRIQVRLAHLAASPLANRPDVLPDSSPSVAAISSPVSYIPQGIVDQQYPTGAPLQFVQLPPGASVIFSQPNNNHVPHQHLSPHGFSTIGQPRMQVPSFSVGPQQIMNVPQHQPPQQTYYVIQHPAQPSGGDLPPMMSTNTVAGNQNTSPYYHGQIIYPSQHATFLPY